jgi:DNA-binding MarR family transcriptional regulator
MSSAALGDMGDMGGRRPARRCEQGTPEEACAQAAGQRAGEAGMELWRAAKRWRRVIEDALAGFDLTLAQWLVLDALAKEIAAQSDAVSQATVARRLEMDRVTVSQVTRLLDRRGLVSRGPDLTGPGLRIWVTAAGERLLAQGRPQFDAASARALGFPGPLITSPAERQRPDGLHGD